MRVAQENMRRRSACPEPVVTSRIGKGKTPGTDLRDSNRYTPVLAAIPLPTSRIRNLRDDPSAAASPCPVFNHDRSCLKAYTCTGCHGITGWKNAYPSYHVPRIGGQNYDYLVAALTEYKNGGRKHPTMRAQGESMSDADIADIAAFLSNLKSAE